MKPETLQPSHTTIAQSTMDPPVASDLHAAVAAAAAAAAASTAATNSLGSFGTQASMGPTGAAAATTTATTTYPNSNKRPYDDGLTSAATSSGSANNDDDPMSEKRRRRLEKNRMSARECRRRKKEATEHMQHQINQLEGENLRLRLQLRIGEEAEQSIHQEQNKLTKGLDDLLKSGASESEIYAKIEEYKEKFADYGRDRTSAMEFHLRNVERLLMPTQTTSIVLATLQQGASVAGGTAAAAAAAAAESSNSGGGDEKEATQKSDVEEAVVTAPPNEGNDGKPPAVSTEPTVAETGATSNTGTAPTNSPSPSSAPPKDTKALFKHLVSILQVTPEQAMALKDSRFVAQEMDSILNEALGVLKELRTRLIQCGQDLEQEFGQVRAILTPSQSAKFLVWVAQNKACIHLLNELWSKVYPSDSPPTASTTTTTTTSSSPPASLGPLLHEDSGSGSGGESSP